MDAFAETAALVAQSPGRLRKVALVAEYLRGLDDADLARAVRFFSGAPLATGPVGAGYARMVDAAAAVSALGADEVRRRIHETGDIGEGIAAVLECKTAGLPMTLAEAESAYQQLQLTGRQAEKFEILRKCFERYRPLTLKYFIKVISGELRIGLQRKQVEEAVAAATGVDPVAIRDASNRSGDLAAVAIAARQGRLSSIEARLFHPMDFMLAKPVESLDDIADPAAWSIEDKYDGIRAQAHVSGGRVAIFTRGLGETTASFPELESALRELPGALALDGEIVAWQDGRALHFNVLQQRLARKVVPLFIPFEAPVVFMAYDLLYRDGRLLLDSPLEERRAELEDALRGREARLPLSPLHSAASTAEIAALFDAARARGNEGLVLKRRGTLYESGRRSGAWVKWKQPYATLDVVITAAERGHGKRASVLSDYTFAVRTEDGYLNVGKAYSGLTDVEIRELTEMLQGMVIGHYGPVLAVRPEIVLEVAFDAIQKSTRHKSGYAMRFPRIVRWRRDKRPEDVDTLDRVRELHDSQGKLS
ncbi:MAG TPA: ATP-dependent DNA ligase [Bryobacteraceae bacterium]|nr:ATP-dependent DNA ligase [Bryobacteraceae bacterium]